MIHSAQAWVTLNSAAITRAFTPALTLGAKQHYKNAKILLRTEKTH
ncbi:hypothetical protein IMCC3135_00980 [Granulosicoccus antarcticus IMCC3135]|uniref:Uncharacterized protein n=1 Tax=Granulosicoccus antarcticus IMCC3135 TaxID=1192854 RepID=A0A2Z2NJS0_9GAMM|nr:hypothetical protein IMCC3135_00980 [Granulosicoccus antarcticus IMCC3135]